MIKISIYYSIYQHIKTAKETMNPNYSRYSRIGKIDCDQKAKGVIKRQRACIQEQEKISLVSR